MPEKFRVVNPTKWRWGHTMPTHGIDNWERQIWEGTESPSESQLVDLAIELDGYKGFEDNAYGGWMQTRPSNILRLKEARQLRIGHLILPLGSRTVAEFTKEELLANQTEELAA